jgi:hypothetical protein
MSFIEYSLRITDLWLHYANEFIGLSRRINVTALRFLSVALLILSLSPLPSIYVLLTSGFNGSASDEGAEPTEGTAISENGGNINVNLAKATSNLMNVIQNPNATLEEIFTAMLLERTNAIGGPFPANMVYHWAAVIPWLLSMFFGLVVPIILYAMSLYRSWRLRQERGANSSEHRIRRRRERILPILSKYKRVRFLALYQGCFALSFFQCCLPILPESNT